MVELYIEDIRECLKNKCYFAALSLTLTLPDICGTIEYPKESSVAKRYINWYDKYKGERLKEQRLEEKQPYISGELVYNLRNQFLHQGNPDIDRDKVKEEVNQIDRFILELGEPNRIYEDSIFLEFAKVTFRGFIINIAYLCESICLTAEWYYSENKDKFKDKFPFALKKGYNDKGNAIINQNALPIADIVYSKLQECDEEFKKLKISREQFEKQFEAQVINTVINTIKEMDLSQIQKAQIESFFDENFKDKKYTDHKEKIINIILNAETRQQVNNALQKAFGGEQAKQIYSVIKPFIKTFPGSHEK